MTTPEHGSRRDDPRQGDPSDPRVNRRSDVSHQVGPRQRRTHEVEHHGERDAERLGGEHHRWASVASGSAKVGLGAARASATATKATLRAARRATNAQGAGESGLGRLIEVHALCNAGDAAVTVGLAGTLFLSAQPGEAKGHVALFLVLTMLPFAMVAPLIGPLLDRYRHGRRWAMDATFALRGFLCWVLADAIERDSTWQFPAALAILVASKAYLVTRSAAAPRLLPEGMTLVKANGRMSLAGVIGAAIGGGLAGGAASAFSSAWAFRVAFVLFVIGTIFAIMLPAGVDSEREASVSGRAPRFSMPSQVVAALRANVGLRWISGFLTMFLAFLMKMHPLPEWEDRATTLLALVVGAAAVGNALGTVLGSLAKALPPRVVVIACLLGDAAAMVVAAVHFTLTTAILVGVVAGLCQQLGKLALDALIQDHLAEAVRTSGFARSETLLQLAWVLGGIFAVIIPTDATIGMYAAAGLLLLWTALVMLWNAGRGPDLGRFMPAWLFGGARTDHRTNYDDDLQTRGAEAPSAGDGSRNADRPWHDERSWEQTRWDESRWDESRSDMTRWDGDEPGPRVRLRKPTGRQAGGDRDPHRRRDH